MITVPLFFLVHGSITFFPRFFIPKYNYFVMNDDQVSETGLELDRCRQEQEAVTVEFYSFKVSTAPSSISHSFFCAFLYQSRSVFISVRW